MRSEHTTLVPPGVMELSSLPPPWNKKLRRFHKDQIRKPKKFKARSDG